MPRSKKKLSTYQNIPYINTFDKQLPIRDTLIQEKKSSSNNMLQNLQNLNVYNSSINSNNNHLGLMLKNNRNKNINIDNIEYLNLKKSQPLINHRNTSRSKANNKLRVIKNINNNNNNLVNSITNDTSAFTHSIKKTFSGLKSNTEDLSKFRMGLFSAGSTPNSNIMIPIIPIWRPASNFNFGGGQLWNTIENKNQNINLNNKNLNYENKENFNNEKDNEEKRIKINKKTRNKFIFQNQDLKRQHNSLPINIEEKIANIEEKIMTKLHKIKVEKGMMNSLMFKNLNSKYSNDYQTYFKQYKNSLVPMIPIISKKNGNEKNNSNSSHEIGNFRSKSLKQ